MPAPRLVLACLTAEQREAICNGCGPACLGWLIPDLLWRDVCDQHDLDYWVGGTARDRVIADKRMMSGLVFSSPWWLLATAVLYFLGVRAFGWLRWHHGARRTADDLPSR